jgi:hypothetical protein
MRAFLHRASRPSRDRRAISCHRSPNGRNGDSELRRGASHDAAVAFSEMAGTVTATGTGTGGRVRRQLRGPWRSRSPARDTDTGHGNGHRSRTRTFRNTWFSGPPACRRVRRWSRLRSGSPPCGGVRRSFNSVDLGHLRASRRPTWWLWRASSERASSWFTDTRVREPGTAEGDATCLGPDGDRRMPGTRPSCPRRLTEPVRTPAPDASHSEASAPLARIAHPNTSALGGVGFQPAQRPRAFGAAAPRRARCPSHHRLRTTGRGASHFAVCASVAGGSSLLQRRLAPPRALLGNNRKRVTGKGVGSSRRVPPGVGQGAPTDPRTPPRPTPAFRGRWAVPGSPAVPSSVPSRGRRHRAVGSAPPDGGSPAPTGGFR